MYGINTGPHEVFSLSQAGEARIRKAKEKCKVKFRRVFYSAVIKHDRWLFVETYEEAKAEQAMLFLSGGGQ